MISRTSLLRTLLIVMSTACGSTATTNGPDTSTRDGAVADATWSGPEAGMGTGEAAGPGGQDAAPEAAPATDGSGGGIDSGSGGGGVGSDGGSVSTSDDNCAPLPGCDSTGMCTQGCMVCYCNFASWVCSADPLCDASTGAYDAAAE
jgi:hypothetical protein